MYSNIYATEGTLRCKVLEMKNKEENSHKKYFGDYVFEKLFINTLLTIAAIALIIGLLLDIDGLIGAGFAGIPLCLFLHILRIDLRNNAPWD